MRENGATFTKSKKKIPARVGSNKAKRKSEGNGVEADKANGE